jgi:aryl-alcohol dehydrogenase-like predicted oxidoreductase
MGRRPHDPTRDIRGRRDFLARALAGTTAAAAGGLAACAGPGGIPAKRTAVDLVRLGRSNLKITRFGLGTGTAGGRVQRALGQEGLTRLVRDAWDRGVRYVDSSLSYMSREYLREAIRGLPREKLVLLSKVSWSAPEGVMPQIERIRRELGVDTVDIVLLHCVNKTGWPAELAPRREELSRAKEMGLIRAHGVSIHGLPALREVAACDWVEVALMRINHTGHMMDGPTGRWKEPGSQAEAAAEIAKVHAAGIGVLGMKLFGNGDFKQAGEREASLRYVYGGNRVDSAAIGFKSAAEIDEAIANINRALNA